METYFAPAGRDAAEEVRRQGALLRDHPLVQATIESVPLPIVILNEKRQAVFTNRSLLELLHASTEELLGRRPGKSSIASAGDRAPTAAAPRNTA